MPAERIVELAHCYARGPSLLWLGQGLQRQPTGGNVVRALAALPPVTGNLASALTTLFGPVPTAIIPLITFRDELRARLRQAKPGGGTAILAQVTTAVSAYLADERGRGRIAADADIDSLTLSLVGGGHLLFSDRELGAPGPPAVQRFVASVLADVLQRRSR